ELDPSNTSTRIKLGELYLREGLNELAYEAFMKAAQQLMTLGENRRALNAYNEAVAVNPSSSEAAAAIAKLTRMLRAAREEKRARPFPRGPPPAGDTARVHAVGSTPSDPQPRVTPPQDGRSEGADAAFVVQEISKAEILVAYKKVDQATSMLREVLRKVPDN